MIKYECTTAATLKPGILLCGQESNKLKCSTSQEINPRDSETRENIIDMKNKLILIGVVVFLVGCSFKSEKKKWAKEPFETKYSKEREKAIWGHVLRGDDPALFYGTPLYDAAEAITNHNSDKVRKLLQGKPLSVINLQDEKYLQPLNVFAIWNQDFNSLKVLTELGADPNLQSKSGRSAMIEAAGNAQVGDDNRYLKYLIANGGDVNAVSKAENVMNRTPLIAASRYKLENVKLLVEAGANPNYIYRYNDKDNTIESGLHVALRSNRIDIVNYLIFEQGVDYNIITKPPFRKGGAPTTIATYLRGLNFSQGSDKYQQKMKLVNYLKEKGVVF